MGLSRCVGRRRVHGGLAPRRRELVVVFSLFIGLTWDMERMPDLYLT